MKNTFYKDVTIHFEFNNDTLFITNPYIPINKSFTINFPIKNKFAKGTYLARADKNDNIYLSKYGLSLIFIPQYLTGCFL